MSAIDVAKESPPMPTKSTTSSKKPNGESEGMLQSFIRWFVPTALAVLGPVVGYIVSAVIVHGQEIAILETTIRAHIDIEAHRGSIPRSELEARLDAIIERLKRIEGLVK